MKRFKIYPKIFVHHFKKRPSRIITWFSIIAIVAALIITNFKLDQIIPRAHAAEIKIEGSKITLSGGNEYKTFDGYEILMNDFIIDVDGYLQARWYPSRGSRPYGFEYIYLRSDNGLIKINPDNGSRIKFDATKDLFISTNTRVYMEGNKNRAINLKSLTIDGDGATLTQIPANRDGLAAPFSTNNYWGVQLFGYYYLGPNREVEFKLKQAGGDEIQLWISRGGFTPEGPDSPWGQRFRLQTSGTEYCSVDSSSGWCKDSSGKTVKFSNPIATKGIFLGVQLLASKKGGNIEFDLTHKEGEIDGSKTSGIVPTAKFVAVNNNVAQGPIGVPLDGGLTNTDLYFAQYIKDNINTNGMIDLAYYYDALGVKSNHNPFGLPDGMLNLAPRSFQSTLVTFDGWGIRNYGLKGSDVSYGGAKYPAFKMRWEENGQGTWRGNPISYSIMDQGEDYLRAPLAGYVQSALVGEDKITERQARINLKVTNSVILTNGGKIDVSGKGYPGGISSDTNITFPLKSKQFRDKNDNPLHGAGFGGGIGAFEASEPYAYSGSYGGNGVIARRYSLTINPEENGYRPLHASNTYGGESINSPQELGSGGGYWQDIDADSKDIASIGGAGGGSIHLSANYIQIDNINNNPSSIKANGGNGFVGNGNCTIPNAETRGILGKPGIKQLPNNQCSKGVNDFLYKERATAGSGGSIWLEVGANFNNLGVIEARGAEGGGRIHTSDPTAVTNKYNEYYNEGKVLICNSEDGLTTDINKRGISDCLGPAGGGGRIAIQYASLGTKGAIRVYGGGVDDNGAQQDIDQTTTDLVGTEGSLIFNQSRTTAVVRTISIDKSVNLCKGDNNSCVSHNVDWGNANAQDGAWMLVQIRLINNIGGSVSNINVTDEIFSFAKNESITFITGGGAKTANRVKWNNLSMTAGQEKTLEYYFQISL